MSETILLIITPNGEKSVTVNKTLTIGRTELSEIVLSDAGLSRCHATFKLRGTNVWIFDENSLNGTFLNNQKVGAEGAILHDGDEIFIGNETRIFVTVRRKANAAEQAEPLVKVTAKDSPPHSAAAQDSSKLVLFIALGSIFLIIGGALAAFLILRPLSEKATSDAKKSQSKKFNSAVPIRVINPINQEPESIEDLLSSWEAQEKPLEVKDLTDIKDSSPENLDLNVTVAMWEKARQKAFEPRNAPTGLAAPNLEIPNELRGPGVPKQTAKIRELNLVNVLPRDFTVLAEKRLKKELIELPLAANFYFLDVGASATDAPFTVFEPLSKLKSPLLSSMAEYQNLATLAADFDGQKYDLNAPRDRRVIKQRLLRMFHPKAKPILEEISRAYSEKFGRPLRVTSLTRSLEYQAELVKINANAFRGTTPPHTTGCAFDLAYKHMTADEQNFLMKKLAEMENRGILDALREGGANACLHVFIYPDGKPPLM